MTIRRSFEPRTSNTRSIETRTLSRTSLKDSWAPRVRPSRPILALDRVDLRLFSENDHHSNLRGSVRSQDPLTLPQNSIGRHSGDVRPEWYQTGPKFQTCSVFRDFCRDVRVDPIILGTNDHNSRLRGSVRSQEPLTLPQNSIGRHRGNVRPEWDVRVDSIILGPNDHHSHLWGSVRSQEPLTLPQNSMGNFRGDVRPDLCQSGLFSVSAGSVCAFRVCARPKQPKPDPTKVQPDFLQSHPISRD
ncbi:hypothetical protein CRG98_013286 [Punica granatum]|uniref:Uncharacterized protein n=1 Tax=Punica granatum TaxID=22663 RepID=A0A2I0KCR7_PUNGR|nr:hypothetical protein CRG98_013286 [Punica granatum]